MALSEPATGILVHLSENKQNLRDLHFTAEVDIVLPYVILTNAGNTIYPQLKHSARN